MVIKEKKIFFFLLFPINFILFFFYIYLDCYKKCNDCEGTVDHCSACNGTFRNNIIPNCNCSEGYYEPLNSNILDCLGYSFTFLSLSIL